MDMTNIEKLEGEEFRQLIEFPKYWVSNKGRCYSTITKKFLKVGKRGVTLRGEGYSQYYTPHEILLLYRVGMS